jgi:flagellar basal body rod protein FlgG
MKSYWDQQHVIADNLSRAGIAGNKQHVAAFMSALGQSPASTIGKPAQAGPAGSHQVVSSPPVETMESVDFSQGPLEQTGDPLNMGIEGSGFFTVRDQAGAVSYTRDGNFHWNPDGHITTSDGAQLLGKGNTPVTVPTTKGLHIAEDGSITQDGSSLGNLALAHFAKPTTDLQETPGGRFTKNAGVNESVEMTIKDRVRSGYLESSNSNSVTQMVNMIDTMRAYEANQKAVTTADDETSKLIQAAKG